MRSVSLILAGSVCGLLGFLFAGFLGIWRFVEEVGHNFHGDTFPSGHNYWPQTVSMMVRDPSTPSGKCFFAFESIAAICILVSWYPWQLRNVYVGDDVSWCGVRVLNMRTLLPPIGMILVSHIQVLPMAQRGFRDHVSGAIHGIGAVMMIGGYSIFELQCLLSKKAPMRGNERCIRWCLVLCTLFCGLCFGVIGATLANSEDLGICCMDVWRVPTIADIAKANGARHPGVAVKNMLARDDDRPRLFDTAHGMALNLKMLEYFMEVMSGIFMILSHWVIWWHCPERQLELGDTLPNPGHRWDGDEEEQEGTHKPPNNASYGAAEY
jgi:hypothetical protein